MDAWAPLRVCSISPLLPYSGMPYAGADYYLRHLSALGDFAEVSVVVPRAPINESSLPKFSLTARVHLADRSRHSGGRLFRVAAALYRRWTVITPGLDFVDSLVDEARRSEADTVEVHFPHGMGLLPRLRRRLPGTTIVAIPHDVHAQGVARVMAHRSARGWRAAVQRLQLRRVERTEARHLNHADLVLVFSDKDRQLLAAAGVTAPIEVLPPALDEPAMADVAAGYRPQGRRLVFVGALDREPNVDAVGWLLDEIMPIVREQVVGVTLTVAGGSASPALVERCAASPDVVMSGYAPDLGPVYDLADVVVAPLRLGAGLKFKVGSAMLWGRPVVATPVAAEGYPVDQGLFGSVTDDAEAFAGAIVALLRDPAVARDTAARARSWAIHEFSTDRLRASLRGHYLGAAASEPSTD